MTLHLRVSEPSEEAFGLSKKKLMSRYGRALAEVGMLKEASGAEGGHSHTSPGFQVAAWHTVLFLVRAY